MAPKVFLNQKILEIYSSTNHGFMGLVTHEDVLILIGTKISMCFEESHIIG